MSMRTVRLAVLLLAPGVFASPAAACSFCAGGLVSRISLGEYYRQSTFVAQGRLNEGV